VRPGALEESLHAPPSANPGLAAAA
jgi:hypothetical protein